MSIADKEPKKVPLRLVGPVVDSYVSDLQRGYLQDNSSAVARLAQLRQGAGKTSDQVPKLWGLTGTEDLYAQGPLDAERAGWAETAVHISVTLYALHQQSHRTRRMHSRGHGLGAAVRQLMPPDRIDEPIRKRFVKAGTASTPDMLASRLREIVALLRRDQIPLDYALLGDQLYRAQQAGGMREVRQAWGRSFHAYRPKKTDSKPGQSSE
jgi:CRISPR system Cascade subunit CasB